MFDKGTKATVEKDVEVLVVIRDNRDGATHYMGSKGLTPRFESGILKVNVGEDVNESKQEKVVARLFKSGKLTNKVVEPSPSKAPAQMSFVYPLRAKTNSA